MEKVVQISTEQVKLRPGRCNEVYTKKHSCATGVVGQAWEDPDMLLHKGDFREARFQGS